ncbi:histone-lysine N-methyltransferase ASHH1 isoform X2 [Aristolochia californica]|uniref:histone-lysine N-methyltransferase ASHH1 isoform X2 n=1 Tax=Aristolochia californica TaxID=171875 RepID=UPI0035D912BB
MQYMDEVDGQPPYIHIEQNDFSFRKHKKQKEEDIAVCDCKYEADNPAGACGEQCLNVLTSTECTPGYCPCGMYCRNQRFQQRAYAKSKLFKTEGRGWGLLADEIIKAGQFIIEYCGEVISWKEARRRAQAYEAAENFSQPNCETRKWTVLGEIRVGIFAKQDILPGAELSYDYNFEWYGGVKVRCLCGAPCCAGFLGAKSRGFQEDTYLWEDDDDRYSVENIPLYDSEEDEPSTKLLRIADSSTDGYDPVEKQDKLMTINGNLEVISSSIEPILAESLQSVLVEDDMKTEPSEESKMYSPDADQAFANKNITVSRFRSNSACRNYFIRSSPLSNKKRAKLYTGGRLKNLTQEFDVKLICQLLPSEEAEGEILACEEAKKAATSQLDSLYDEIRPAIEEHEKDSQDNVSTAVAEKWIGASCSKLKAEFNLYYNIIKHISAAPRRVQAQALQGESNQSEVE